MYTLFPIGWMYYFGTNLDNKFSVDGFWPKPEQTHKIPFEREEIDKELERLKRKRLALRDRRLAEEAALARMERGDTLDAPTLNEAPRQNGELGILKEVKRRQEGWRD